MLELLNPTTLLDTPLLSPENTPTLPKMREPDWTNGDDLAMFEHLRQGFESRHSPAGRTRMQMAEAYFCTPWVQCVCGIETTKLGESGVCIDCESTVKRSDRLEKAQYEYLVKTIGKYGLERFTIDSFNVEPGNRLAFEFISNFAIAKDNVFLTGPCGVGKTHLAGIIFKDSVSFGFHSRWATPMYLNRIFRMKSGDEEETLLDDYAKCAVLIIDDLGVGKETEFTLRILYEIMARRMMSYRNGLVITSNLTLDDISKKTGDDRLSSRIKELCKIFSLMSSDRRLRTRG